MAFDLRITHLCVGQGLSVLIELSYTIGYADRTFVALLDLGSSIGGNTFYSGALQKIMRAARNNNGTIDYVHVSHFDDDHYNLFEKLSENYNKAYHSNITITNLIYGSFGTLSAADIQARKDCFNTYTVGNTYTDTAAGAHRTGNPYTALTGRSIKDINIALGDNFYFRINTLLYSAHLFPLYKRGGKSVIINSGSSIILTSIVQHNIPIFSYLFTGDATKFTFACLNVSCKLAFGSELKLMTMPHHGTKKHVADKADDYTTLIRFLISYEPNAAVASAKCKNQRGWSHPDADTVHTYSNRMTDTVAPRIVTAFTWDTKMKVKKLTRSKRIYTTYALANAPNNALYENWVNSSWHEKYDIIAEFSSTNLYSFTTREVRVT